MEKTIEFLLDTLDREETELLLQKNRPLALERKKQRRINHLLLMRHTEKNKKTNKKIKRSLALAASLIVLAATSLSVFGDSNLPYHLSSAIDSLYSFVPNYGFVEINESPSFILDKPVTVENEAVALTLTGAYITDNNLTTILTLHHKNMSHEDFLQQKQAKNEKDHSRSSLSLHVNENTYESSNGWKSYEDYTGVSTSGLDEQIIYQFTLEGTIVQATTAYRLSHAEHRLTLSFSLAPFSESFIDELPGSTDNHNDIFIMASPSFSESQLEVTLFPINNSDYSLYSFSKDGIFGGPDGQDIHLESESGIKNYEAPGGSLGPNTKFNFPIESTDQNFTLRIPFIMIKANEYLNLRLPIPKRGKTIPLNMTLNFHDCTVTIVEAERRVREDVNAKEEELRLLLSYENKTDNKILSHPSVNRLTRSGKIKSGGYSFLPDDQGITQEIYILLEKWDWGSLYLQFYNPTYFLTDEYSFTFTRQE